MIVAALTLASISYVPVEVKVTDVQRTTVTLGEMGDRVTESWTIQLQSQSAVINFHAYHTNYAGTPEFRSTGDNVELKLSLKQFQSLKSGETVQLPISAIR